MKPTNVFSIGRAFVLMAVIVFGCFLWAGGEAAMTKLGFETKTSLQKKLSEANQALQQAQQTNKDNAEELARIKAENTRIVKELETLTDKKQLLEDEAKKLKESLDKKTAEARKSIEKKKVVTEETITLPIAEVNAMSEANIETLQDSFDTFFPKDAP